MRYKVIDNLLPDEELSVVKSMLSTDFPWFWGPVIGNKIIEEEFYNFQFEHWFYSNYGFSSNFKHLIYPILEKLNILSIVKVKANLIPVANRIIEHDFHIDSEHPKSMKTAIFYVNTNNGKTVFKSNDKTESVESVENRLVVFDTDLLHTGTTCTDERRRVVINFNFFEKNF